MEPPHLGREHPGRLRRGEGKRRRQVSQDTVPSAVRREQGRTVRAEAHVQPVPASAAEMRPVRCAEAQYNQGGL